MLNALLSRLGGTFLRSRNRLRTDLRVRLVVEQLEDRQAPAVFTVISTADPTDAQVKAAIQNEQTQSVLGVTGTPSTSPPTWRIRRSN
jgi:hypothetical protein